MESDKGPVWSATVLSLFPEMFPGPLGHSLAGRALTEGVWALDSVDIRAFARDKHRSVDDTPFGGGAGMVMRPDVVDAAIRGAHRGGPLIYLTPARAPAGPAAGAPIGGRTTGNVPVRPLRGGGPAGAGRPWRRGGQPWRLRAVRWRTGGIDGDGCRGAASARGGRARRSRWRKRVSSGGCLEYPHYTRPQTWDGRAVPEMLLSGHHEKIRAWRLRQAEDGNPRATPAGPLGPCTSRRTTDKKRVEPWTSFSRSRQEQIAKLTAAQGDPGFRPGRYRQGQRQGGRRHAASAFRPMRACASPRKNDGLNSSFTVRKISYGEGVERVFPLYSPNVASIEVVRRGDVRRAKLYYLRDRRGKSARIAEQTTG